MHAHLVVIPHCDSNRWLVWSRKDGTHRIVSVRLGTSVTGVILQSGSSYPFNCGASGNGTTYCTDKAGIWWALHVYFKVGTVLSRRCFSKGLKRTLAGLLNLILTPAHSVRWVSCGDGETSLVPLEECCCIKPFSKTHQILGNKCALAVQCTSRTSQQGILVRHLRRRRAVKLNIWFNCMPIGAGGETLFLSGATAGGVGRENCDYKYT